MATRFSNSTGAFGTPGSQGASSAFGAPGSGGFGASNYFSNSDEQQHDFAEDLQQGIVRDVAQTNDLDQPPVRDRAQDPVWTADMHEGTQVSQFAAPNTAQPIRSLWDRVTALDSRAGNVQVSRSQSGELPSPGAFPLSPIIKGIAGRKASAPLLGTSLGERRGYGDGIIYTSRLGNLGVAQGADPGDATPIFEGLVGLDNALYDHFDDTARDAIASGFTWDGGSGSGSMVRDRYRRMLDHAALAGSEGAVTAQKTLKDAQTDYRRAATAIRERMSKVPQEPEKVSLFSAGTPGGETSTKSPEAVAAAVSAAFEDYKKNGGQMSQGMFENTFAKLGVSVPGAQAQNADAADASGRRRKVNAAEMAKIRAMAEADDMSDDDFFSTYIGGLKGYRYADLVAEAAEQGRSVQDVQREVVMNEQARATTAPRGRGGLPGPRRTSGGLMG
jgi:hypothetical protein